MRSILRGQLSGNDHAVRRHGTVADLARGAVVDARALAQENTHADHAVMADNEAFHHLRTRADEAMVLDDRRRRLQRFQHAADARTATEVAMLADLRAGPDRCPRIHHRALT